jgi:hypothetical protein
MHSQVDYLVKLTAAPDHAVAERAYSLAWRGDFTAPGFCLLDAGPGVDSQTLRQWMVLLKGLLGEIAQRRTGKPFRLRSVGRFDQQETTKFHLDGAPERSMLMLGYEPSRVKSRLFLADYSHAAFDLGITPQQFLSDLNPMFRKGEEHLAPYATELPQPEPGHARILLVNNSSLPFTEARTNPLGLMHKAIIVTPDGAEQRVVNSTMLVTEGEEIGSEERDEFVTTDKLSPKVY